MQSLTFEDPATKANMFVQTMELLGDNWLVKEDVIGVGGLYLCHLEQVTPHHG
jgi:hypothetical protein